jgi:peptidoglycan/LPS O-acetylase OafA/YrhL
MALPYRRDIDGLRTVAVMPVALGHAGLSLFEGGFVGVDVFFVISGFLITTIIVREIEAGRFSLIKFYEHRARRILPALFLVLMLCFVVAWFLLPPQTMRGLGTSAIATLFFASNILFWRNASDYFAPDVLTEPLLHTWSLAVEEQFYLFFPLLLMVLAGWARPRIALLIAGLVAVSFVYAVWAVQAHPVAAFYLIPARLWELGLGALLALGVLPPLRSRAMAEGVAGLGLIAILAAVFTLHEASPFPGLNALAPCLGAAAIIWAGQSQVTLTARFLSLAPMVWIGLISYSLYLFHWPVIVWARMITGMPHLPLDVAWLCIGLSVLLAWTSWRIVERPFRDRDTMSRRAIFAFSGAGGVVLACFAAAVAVTNGLPQRLPADVATAYEEAIRRGHDVRACRVGVPGTPACTYGAPRTGAIPDVIVWGDSHARVMQPGLHAWANGQGLSVESYAMGACLPLAGVRRLDESWAPDCVAHVQGVLEGIAAYERVPLVILTGRWALSAEGTRADGETGNPVRLLSLPDAPAALRGADNAALFDYGLDRTLANIVPHADRVVLMGGVPEIGFHVPNTLVQSTLLFQPMPDPPALQAYAERHARANPILARLADSHGAVFADLGPVFCTPACAIRDDTGALLYSDDNHLSEHGARRMVPAILDAVFPNPYLLREVGLDGD